MMMSEPARSQVAWHPSSFQRRVEIVIACSAITVIALVYTATHWLAPHLFTHFDHAPELAALPKRTATAKHRKGDPVNVAAVGTEAELRAAMSAAGWKVADRADRRTDIAIAASVLFNRPDSTAPVSPLYLFGRAQDIAFEREVGRSARSRHHARFWLAQGVTHDDRPVWLGAATFDLRAGIGRRSDGGDGVGTEWGRTREELSAGGTEEGRTPDDRLRMTRRMTTFNAHDPPLTVSPYTRTCSVAPARAQLR